MEGTLPLTGIEMQLANIGLGAPATRFAVFSGATALAFNLMKPEMFFQPNGEPKPWSFMSGSSHATSFPWWLASVSVGVLGMIII